MSASMRDWIRPLVESELNSALTGFGRIYVPGQSVQEGSRACGPDTVTVHVKKGREVQIIEFNGRNGNPCEATVSDGTSHIRATFDQVATDLFAEMNGRDFLEIRGGVIALLDYNIVSKFKFRGSEGSNPFGRPSDILENGRIREVLGRLHALLDGDDCENEIRSQPPSPIRPREVQILADANSLSSSSSASQEAFATQIPGRVPKKPSSQAEIEVPKVGMFTHLMGLLSKKPLPEQSGSSTPNSASFIPSNTSAKAIPRKAVLTPASSDQILEMTSKLEAKANERSSQSSLSQERRAVGSKSPSVSVKISIPKDLPEPLFDDSEKENSQESLKTRIPILDGFKIETMAQTTVVEENIQTSVIDHFQNNDPFLGLKRVPRRFVRIQQSQERLLEEKDSWYKPPVDHRSSYANLPAKVRDDLVAFSGRPPTMNEPNEGGQASQVDSADSDDGEEAQYKSPACESDHLNESEEAEEEESPQSMDDEEVQVEPPRIRLEVPPPTGGSLYRSQEGQSVPTHSNIRQTTITSPSKPSNLGEERDEIHQPESDDVTSDEDIVSWPSSPEFGSMAIKRNIEVHDLPSSLANDHEDHSKLSGSNQRHSPNTTPDMRPNSRFAESRAPSPSRHRNDAQQQHPQTTRRLWPRVAVPSSSPVEEQELEYAIPYAIGDLVEESDTDAEPSETFQRRPLPPSQNEELVQVEQTPFPQLRYSGGRSIQIEHADNSLNGSKQIEDLISSDPRIPATCEAAALEQTTPGSSEATGLRKELDMRMLTVEYRNDGNQRTSHLRATINIKEEDENDNLAQHPLSAEHETSHLGCAVLPTSQDAISLDIVGHLQESRQEEHTAMVTPSRNQGSAHMTVQQSSPLLAPLTSNSGLDGGSPVMMGSGKRDNEHLGALPRNPVKRRRYATDDVARTIIEEDSPAGDSRDIVRIYRHKNLPLAREISPTIQSSSYPEAPNGKEVIPSTIPTTAKSSTPLPDPATRSADRDDVQHIPATFKEPSSTPQPTSSQNLSKLAQSKDSDHCQYPDPASPINEMDAGCASDAKVSDAILRGSFLPMDGNTAHSEVDFYEQFIHIYPGYLGSKNAFARALVNIEWIRENDLFLPWARYDDFIQILASDWLNYLDKNRGLGGKLMSGLKYYEMNFPDQPSFKSKFITGENLQDALASLDAEQVAEYRAKFREPPHKEVPVQTVKSASPHTMATTQSTSMDLDTEEQTLIRSSREASLELGSTNDSVFDSGPRLHERSISPELGSANNSSGSFNHRPKRPFFETHSQLPIAQRQAVTPEFRRSSMLEVNTSEPKSNSRILPWMTVHSSPSLHLSPRSEAKFLTRTASIRKDNGQPPSTGQRYGSSPSSQPRKGARKQSSTPPSRDLAAVSGRHSLPTSSVSSLFRPIIAKHATSAERITPKRLMQEFIARKNKNGSTPKTTPRKRFCTKPARSSPKQLEPETQGWDL
ncbi:hypothetical protein L207DRAFT_534975 [Hyaloscypha variabilis F]|uniref:Shelterin complex subunit TPP1/Est3 domain-containing protein n=1 Tax=Hyaloscypha variabilis (strain UAMH 11265 / GT02V1 / F) TaxID=1149755 RepID=A0A2J6R5B8_HYAVF|nr:hypothetical protein L207DRAFT_534975 [Hyaloscypha variabilis F]